MENQAYLKPCQNQTAPISLLTTTLIGSSDEATLKLPRLAPRQVKIELTEGRFMLRRMSSSTKVTINNVEVLEAALNEGDYLEIGEYSFYFSFLAGRRELHHPGLLSKNTFWQKELEMLTHAAKTDFPILLLGPSGTGKDVVAQALHSASSRHTGPFVSVNCSALTETLVESELFGHVKGAFTGAVADRKGAFETARGGTLFLDEIGDLPKGLQAKILRALENQEIRPVGSDKTIKTNVRIIAATHQDLVEKIDQGQFRADLYFRLNVVAAHPPALKNRLEDFEDLLATFCKLYRVSFSFMAIQDLKKYSWPGNIRELKNMVARASALFPQTRIDSQHIQRLLGSTVMQYSVLQDDNTPLDERTDLPVIKEIERQMIIKRLKANKGNQRRTAMDLKMPKSTLNDRLRYYDINPADFRI